MTFADLYQLHRKCEKAKDRITLKKPYVDGEGCVNLKLDVNTYEDLKELISDCQALIFDVCQANVKDVMKT